MATVNGIFDLPGFAQSPPDPGESSAVAVPRYFAAFEREIGLEVLRPVQVSAVRPLDADPRGELLVETDDARWTARAVINATGTWTAPRRPEYPGAATFGGRQLHVADYQSAEQLRGLDVAIVGGGISAIQLLDEISAVATTHWFTRREPVWLDGDFTPETTGRAVIDQVEADVRAGRPVGSIVSYTGLVRSAASRAAQARGALVRRPMFVAIEPEGVRLADGSLVHADAIVWATGFGAALGHLAPLGIDPERGIMMSGTAVADEPRVHLIGYGPSQSTVGANRAGRQAVAAVERVLGITGS